MRTINIIYRNQDPQLTLLVNSDSIKKTYLK